MTPTDPTKIWVVRNREGKYFRAVGYGRSGDHWVDELNRARLYAKLSQAKSRVTFYYRAYPSYGCPDIVEFTLSEGKVVDMTQETTKKVAAIKERKMKAERHHAKIMRDHYAREMEQLQTKISALS